MGEKVACSMSRTVGKRRAKLTANLVQEFRKRRVQHDTLDAGIYRACPESAEAVSSSCLISENIGIC
jgi:hypothetical protein